MPKSQKVEFGDLIGTYRLKTLPAGQGMAKEWACRICRKAYPQTYRSRHVQGVHSKEFNAYCETGNLPANRDMSDDNYLNYPRGAEAASRFLDISEGVPSEKSNLLSPLPANEDQLTTQNLSFIPYIPAQGKPSIKKGANVRANEISSHQTASNEQCPVLPGSYSPTAIRQRDANANRTNLDSETILKVLEWNSTQSTSAQEVLSKQSTSSPERALSNEQHLNAVITNSNSHTNSILPNNQLSSVAASANLENDRNLLDANSDKNEISHAQIQAKNQEIISLKELLQAKSRELAENELSQRVNFKNLEQQYQQAIASSQQKAMAAEKALIEEKTFSKRVIDQAQILQTSLVTFHSKAEQREKDHGQVIADLQSQLLEAKGKLEESQQTINQGGMELDILKADLLLHKDSLETQRLQTSKQIQTKNQEIVSLKELLQAKSSELAENELSQAENFENLKQQYQQEIASSQKKALAAEEALKIGSNQARILQNSLVTFHSKVEQIQKNNDQAIADLQNQLRGAKGKLKEEQQTIKQCRIELDSIKVDFLLEKESLEMQRSLASEQIQAKDQEIISLKELLQAKSRELAENELSQAENFENLEQHYQQAIASSQKKAIATEEALIEEQSLSKRAIEQARILKDSLLIFQSKSAQTEKNHEQVIADLQSQLREAKGKLKDYKNSLVHERSIEAEQKQAFQTKLEAERQRLETLQTKLAEAQNDLKLHEAALNKEKLNAAKKKEEFQSKIWEQKEQFKINQQANRQMLATLQEQIQKLEEEVRQSKKATTTEKSNTHKLTKSKQEEAQRTEKILQKNEELQRKLDAQIQLAAKQADDQQRQLVGKEQEIRQAQAGYQEMLEKMTLALNSKEEFLNTHNKINEQLSEEMVDLRQEIVQKEVEICSLKEGLECLRVNLAKQVLNHKNQLDNPPQIAVAQVTERPTLSDASTQWIAPNSIPIAESSTAQKRPADSFYSLSPSKKKKQLEQRHLRTKNPFITDDFYEEKVGESLNSSSSAEILENPFTANFPANCSIEGFDEMPDSSNKCQEMPIHQGQPSHENASVVNNVASFWGREINQNLAESATLLDPNEENNEFPFVG